MKNSKILVLVTLAVGLIGATVPLKASDPVGVYALIEKVVLEPNDAAPTAAQIWGVFSLAAQGNTEAAKFGDRSTNDSYGAVQTGYLYFSCPSNAESICRAEWNDLKNVAGKGDIYGFGGRWTANGRVRAANEKPTAPDPYPTNVGVVKIGLYPGGTRPGQLVTAGMQNRTQYPDLIAALKDAARKK